jgi:PIN domain nuclease of toxin-antitoxin system
VILLDTHVWVWYLDNPDILSRNALSHLEHAKERRAVYVSSISVWEVCMLEKKGRISFSIPVKEWIQQSERLSFFNFIPVDNAIAEKSVSLDGGLHSDPADRIIIATALLRKYPLITKDAKIIDYEKVSAIW